MCKGVPLLDIRSWLGCRGQLIKEKGYVTRREITSPGLQFFKLREMIQKGSRIQKILPKQSREIFPLSNRIPIQVRIQNDVDSRKETSAKESPGHSG